MRTTMTIKVTRGKFKGQVIVVNANADVPAKFRPFKVIDGTPAIVEVAVAPVDAVEEVVEPVEVEEAVEEATETETETEPTETENA